MTFNREVIFSDLIIQLATILVIKYSKAFLRTGFCFSERQSKTESSHLVPAEKRIQPAYDPHLDETAIKKEWWNVKLSYAFIYYCLFHRIQLSFDHGFQGVCF